MADKKISDFATLADAKDDDLILVSSNNETYNMKVKTLKDATQKVAVDAVAAAEAAKTAATNANSSANSAIINASNAMEDAAETREMVNELDKECEEMSTVLTSKVDGAYVENGALYLTSNDEVVAGPFSGFGGGGSGGGGSGNNAVLTFTNSTGWLSKTVAQDSDCVIKAVWSSVEDDLATGNGVLKVLVNGAIKATFDVPQGEVSVNLKNYLSAGSNPVKLNITDVYGNSRTINFTVSVVALSLTSAFDASTPFTDTILFTYIPTGSVTKTMHFILDEKEIGTAQIAVSGRQQSYSIPAQKHGAHSLRVFFDAEIDGQLVSSNELYYELICLVDGDTTPVIVSDFNQTEAAQYSTILVEYRVYDPANLTSTVDLIANGTLVNTVTVDRTPQQWSYRADDAGDLELTIKCGDIAKTIILPVTETNISIDAETENLSLYLTSYGRNNNADDRDVWAYGDISASFSGFNWVSDGWQLDEASNTVLRVTGDARVEIPVEIFKNDFRTTGKTIEVEFASRDVLDYDAMILSSVSEGRGIEITAQRADMTSEQSTIGTQYKEDEHVRLTFVTEKRSGNRLILIYLNGIISGIKQYPSDDDFTQGTPVGLSIGSNDCTIDLYNIRVYDNDLTRYQTLDNWIADTQNITDRLERYRRNLIYDDYGKVVKEKLPQNLPYMVLEGAALPTDKGDKKTISGYYVDPLNPKKSFVFSNAEIDVQGTSSKDYYVKNFKIKFKGGFEISGVIVDNYQLRDDSIPTNIFTMKADVASSEGANNVELVRLYNDITPHQTPPQANNPNVRQGIDGLPIVIFWDNGTSIAFHGKYNFNNDKATAEVFGFSEGDESWEIRNNVSDRVMFKIADFSDTSAETGWLNDFEARYPEDNTDSTNLAAFVEWVVSTDRTAATGNALGAAVEYEGVSYTEDTEAYRLAKFRNELADHASVDSAIFYWLFTEFFLMVDSRAKNAFPTRFAADGKWCWLPYDMDTAIGINNEGALVFDYALEDTDYTASGAQVFNGQQSVFWNNVRDAFPDEIKELYVNLRTDGKLTYEDVMERFDNHQAIWPEAIMNEDAYRKYIEPYEVEGATMYFAMAQGKKELQRTWWLYNRFRYFDAKYDTGDVASDRILIRIYADADIAITPYADTYLRSKYGSYAYQVRAKRGQEYLLHCYVDSANDLETTLYPASLLAEIADLSGLKIGLADFSKAVKLQVLKIGDGAADYSNGNLTELTLGNNTLLHSLDVRNCPNLAHAVDLSGCSNIETVYFDGTAITGLSLPNGGMVRTLHLPGTVTNFTLLNQSKITDFVLPSYSQITTLRLENVSSAIDTAAILAAIPENSRVRLIGLDWTMDDAEAVLALYDHLDTMRGLDESGNNMDKAQVSGTLHIDSLTGAQLAEMQERYPYITIDYKHITSYCYFYSYDGSTLLYTASVQDGGDAVYGGSTPSRSSTAQYTYSFVGWSTSMNATSANANALKAVTADRNVYAAFSATVRTYTVYFYNGSTLLQTVTNVPYGGSASYTGETPVDPDGDGREFEGWSPSPTSITGNTSCYAQYVNEKEVAEITDDWATILAAIDDGTYRSKYKVGNYKALDLGSEGVVNMQIAGFDKDTLADGSGMAPISWISQELLTTSHRMNPSRAEVYDYKEQAATTTSNNNTSVSADSTKTTSFRAYIQAGEVAEITNTINATADGTLTITYKGLSSSYGTLNVLVNGEVIVSDYASTTAATYTVELVSGDTVTIVAKFTSVQVSSSAASVAFLSTGTFTITTACNNVVSRYTAGYQEATGSIGGWEKSEMRTYLQDTVKPLIPEEIRNRLRTVSKTQPAYNTSGSSFTQTTEDDVWIPSYNECFGSSSMYKALFENTNANRIKYKVGSSSASSWWLRSAISTPNFYSVPSSGGNYYTNAHNSYGVALGFCL